MRGGRWATWWWFYSELFTLRPMNYSSNKEVLDMFAVVSLEVITDYSVFAFTTCSKPVPRDTTHQRATSELLQSIFEASIGLFATNSRFRSHVNHSTFQQPSVTGQFTSLNHTLGEIGDRLGDRKASASHPCLLELDELGKEVGYSPFMTPVESEGHGLLMVPSFAKSKPFSLAT